MHSMRGNLGCVFGDSSIGFIDPSVGLSRGVQPAGGRRSASRRISGLNPLDPESAMRARSAFWVGRLKPEFASGFVAAIDQEIVPAIKQLPGVRSVRALWPRHLEDQPPAIACQVPVEFASSDDIALMLASPNRRALRARVLELAAQFDGTLSHVNYESAG